MFDNGSLFSLHKDLAELEEVVSGKSKKKRYVSPSDFKFDLNKVKCIHFDNNLYTLVIIIINKLLLIYEYWIIFLINIKFIEHQLILIS